MKPALNTGRLVEPAGRPDKTTPGLRGHSKPGVLVFFAVLTGARVAGVWGAIFGVPIVAVLVTMISFYRATKEERAARLLEHLPADELVSVDVVAPPEPIGEALISSGKGVARP